jgi:uncharacterized protein (TIGR02145 family)
MTLTLKWKNMQSKNSPYNLLFPAIFLMFITAFRQDDNKETLTDYDGNIYHVVVIGTQTWMVENLKTTHYRNGNPISFASDNKQWFTACSGDPGLQGGAYCNYDNDVDNVAVYGRLYNNHAVNDSRNICPPGWHIPAPSEWKILESYLGGAGVAGGKMKEAGTKHWTSPNKGADNSSGFRGVPGGFRINTGEFGSIGFVSYMWSSGSIKLDGTEAAWLRLVSYSAMSINHNDYSEATGFSVRCIKDK